MGLSAAAVIFLGGAINWWIVIPVLYVIKEENTAVFLWANFARYLGVGAMLTGKILLYNIFYYLKKNLLL